MIYILDTNILVHAIRESALFSDLNKRFQLTNAKNQNVISVVTIGELYSPATIGESVEKIKLNFYSKSLTSFLSLMLGFYMKRMPILTLSVNATTQQ